MHRRSATDTDGRQGPRISAFDEVKFLGVLFVFHSLKEFIMVTQVKWKVGAMAALLLMAATPAWAQRQTQPQPGQRQAGQQGQFRQGQAQQRTSLRPVEGQESLADREIASWLLLGNEMEVQLAQLAVKQSQSKQVREFAEMLIKDHGNLINELRPFAPDVPSLAQAGQERTGIREEGQQPAQQQGQNRQQQGQQQNQQQAQQNPVGQQGQLGQGQQQGGGLPIIQISYQLAERGLNSIRQELSHKQGSQFDKAFVGLQIHQHMACLNTMEVLRPYASPQLAKVIDQAVPATQSHLQHAKQVMEELSGDRIPESKTGDRGQRDSQQGNNKVQREQD